MDGAFQTLNRALIVGKPHTFAQSRQSVAQLPCYNESMWKSVEPILIIVFGYAIGAGACFMLSFGGMAVLSMGLYMDYSFIGACTVLGGLIGAVWVSSRYHAQHRIPKRDRLKTDTSDLNTPPFGF